MFYECMIASGVTLFDLLASAWISNISFHYIGDLDLHSHSSWNYLTWDVLIEFLILSLTFSKDYNCTRAVSASVEKVFWLSFSD